MTIPNFSTTAVINGNTLIVQADEQLNILMNDVKAYAQNTYTTVSNTLQSDIATALSEVQALYDSFDDRYLGSKSANPTTDNDGNVLVAGTLYFNNVVGDIRVYNGVNWNSINNIDTYTKTEVQNTLPAIGLDTLLNTNPNVGQMTWNIDDSTINVGLPFNIIGQMFQEYFVPVKNQSGHTLLNGRPVMSVGTTGNSGKILIDYHSGLPSNIRNTLGFTTSDIANGADGLVTVSGKVRSINTTGSVFGETWVDNDLLYIKPNTSGMLTKVEPNETELKCPIALVIHAHTNGTLLIRTIPIDENHDKVWINNKLALKADTSSVYTQAQMNTLLEAIELRLEALEALNLNTYTS